MKFMDMETLVDTMLTAATLQEILDDNDLEDGDVLRYLIRAGLIEVPDWCEAPDLDIEED